MKNISIYSANLVSSDDGKTCCQYLECSSLNRLHKKARKIIIENYPNEYKNGVKFQLINVERILRTNLKKIVVKVGSIKKFTRKKKLSKKERLNKVESILNAKTHLEKELKKINNLYSRYKIR